ncbi:radical SAM protein [uncultured Bradyrhizobium sp.]|uniref:radical SAM protein n=1 Tax=uncultured Bradyrhizobium sp. TaxID=199684 RepID=UPI0035CBB5E6
MTTWAQVGRTAPPGREAFAEVDTQGVVEAKSVQRTWLTPQPPSSLNKPASLEDVWLILNYACDARCKLCHIDGLSTKLKPVDVVFAQMREGRRQSVGGRIGFSGGEPTLRHDLPDIFVEAKRLGFKRIHLYTHGRKFADRDYAERLVRAGLTSAQISMHGASAESNNEFMGYDGTMETWQGIANLASLGVSMVVNTVLNKSNVDELKQIYLQTLPFAPAVVEYRVTYPIIQRAALRNSDSLVSLEQGIDRLDELFAMATTVPIGTELFPICLLKSNVESSVEWRFRNQADFMIDAEHSDSARIQAAECFGCAHHEYCTGLQSRYVRQFGAPRIRPRPLEQATCRLPATAQ